MYINKLHLRAFGKFVYKRLYFENKFNIIYGENEAGKSTVHNFIEAALYGFDEDELGFARYDKYKPWDSKLYKGSLGLRDLSGEKYLVARDFLLGTTQVFNKSTDDSEMQEKTITSPGEHFFNMNKISFRNTVSVRQLGNKTEKELAGELKNKIINLSKTRDETISLERILHRLNSVKEEAGDENNDKTLLGQYSLRLNELKNSRENSINAKRQVMFLAMEKKKTGSKIQELDIRIQELNRQIAEYELSIDKDKFLRAEPVQNELNDINDKLSHFSEEELKNYSDADFKEAVKIESALNLMYSQRRSLEDELAEKKEKSDNLKADICNKIDEQFDIDKINIDYANYKNNTSKINDLKLKIDAGKQSISSINIEEIDRFIRSYGEVEEINRKMEAANIFLDKSNYEKMKSYKSLKSGTLILLFIIASAAIGGVWWASFEYSTYIKDFIDRYYVLNESVNISAAAATALIAIIFILTAKPVLNRIKSAKNEIDSMECEFADYTISLNRMEEEKQEIVDQEGCDDFDEMTERYNKLNKEKGMYEEKNRLISYDTESLNASIQEKNDLEKSLLEILAKLNIKEVSAENIKEVNNAYARVGSVKEAILELSESIEQLNQKLAKFEKEIKFEEKRLEIILESNAMEDLEAFREAVEYSEKYTELLNNKDYKESILKKILVDEDFEDLKSRTKNVESYEIKKIDKKEYQLNIYKLENEKSKLLESVDNIVKEIDEIESNARNLAEVEEEIDFYENKINAFKQKIKVVEVAADRIIKISDSIKGDFMPLLRKSISDNFSYLTGGRYSEVLIDENMNIAVVEEDNKDRRIELESLSGGTLDQMYLSLRIGLGNILSGNQNIPLIFDDSFVQYDTRRLKNSLEMLAKESERRQIILFTCQEREAELTKQMNIKFNYIKL